MAMSKKQSITPKCCKEVQEKQTVFLNFDTDDIYGNSEGQKDRKPKWNSKCWNTKYRCIDSVKINFCPHCGISVPEIKKRKTKEKICSVIDGGYYCDTCKLRLNECTCYKPEYAWEPVENKNGKPFSQFAIDLLNEMQKFFRIHFGYGNLQYIYTYMDRWKEEKKNDNMKKSLKVLAIVGTYSDEGGKESFFGEQICKIFNNHFIRKNVKCINGGTYEMLEEAIKDIKKYQIILWMAGVDNSYKKLLPEIKKTHKKCFLIQSKRVIEKKYHTFDVVSHFLKAHSNLGIMITKKDKKYCFNVLDPLGNSWIETSDIKEAAYKIATISDDIFSMNRIGSVSVGNKSDFQLETKFISIVKKYGEKFSELIKAIHPERFLGNASTRCMHGFPSLRLGDYYFMSQRNIDKTIIDSSKFVKIERDENSVKYFGNNKPSVDAPVQIRLYNFYKNVDYIIHGHVLIEGAPITSKHIPCGFIEEFDEIWRLYPNEYTCNFSVNLLGHGCIILAKDLDYFKEIKLVTRNFPDKTCQIGGKGNA